ncbi:MAG: cupin domain-containing protein [Armatimonadota bacterium]
MLIRDLRNARYFTAGDGTTLCEWLHPLREEERLQMGYSLAHARLQPGEASRPHRLRESSEVFVILSGEGVISVDEETALVVPGQAVYVPPGAVQYLRNTGSEDFVFICLVSPPWRAEDEENALFS